jgi:hypothetical protein
MANLSTMTLSLAIYVFGIIRAAKRIHQMLIKCILGTTFRYIFVVESVVSTHTILTAC